MKPRTYRAAVDQVLKPLGFERAGNDWVRRVGDVQECINLQNSGLSRGVTVNVMSVDVASKQLLVQAIPPDSPGYLYWITERIGHLMGSNDKWWKSDRGGPAEVADAIRNYALPYLEKVRGLGEQAERFGRGSVDVGVPDIPSRLWLAVTLYRMGEREEACRALGFPDRRTDSSAWTVQVHSLRRYLDCQSPGAAPSPRQSSGVLRLPRLHQRQ
jgi:hypothetical protein